jgi:hypothetical protein
MGGFLCSLSDFSLLPKRSWMLRLQVPTGSTHIFRAYQTIDFSDEVNRKPSLSGKQNAATKYQVGSYAAISDYVSWKLPNICKNQDLIIGDWDLSFLPNYQEGLLR